MAFWMNVDCSLMLIEPEYLKSTLSLAAASWAPFWIWSQKTSPGGAWVTMAIVRRGTSVAAGAALCAPPWLLHAAVAISRPAATPTTTWRLRNPNIDVPSCGAGSTRPGGSGLRRSADVAGPLSTHSAV